jgi:uncharacterized repeat protein (TIGR01451 family)
MRTLTRVLVGIATALILAAPGQPQPALELTVSGSPSADHGDPVAFAYVVENTGDVDLYDVQVTDEACQGVGQVLGNEQETLPPGGSWQFACERTMPVHTDTEGGSFADQAQATATSGMSAGQEQVSDTGSHAVGFRHPAVAIDTVGPELARAGEPVRYTLAVTNPGDVSFLRSRVSVVAEPCPQTTVELASADPTPDTLDPGDEWSYACEAAPAAGATSVRAAGYVTASDHRTDHAFEDVSTAVTYLTETGTLEDADPVVDPVFPVVSGTATLTGPSRCVRRAFRARVRGDQILAVRWAVDGRRAPATSLSLRVDPRRLRRGRHAVTARISFAESSSTAPVTRTLRFRVC